MAKVGPRIARELRSNARKLRRELTVPERKIWTLLRDRRLGGLKFRRQFPVGPFIADFCCADVKLIIELDGESHVGREDHDAARTRELERLGYKVIRFMNDDVLKHEEAVAIAIARAAGLNW